MSGIITYSVEIEPTGYTDDLFNGTLNECIEYIKAHGYTGAEDGARIAKIQLGEDGTVSSTLDIITADYWEQEQTTTAEILSTAADIINGFPARSAWSKGVIAYALELLDNLADLDPDKLAEPKEVSRALLNGADSWKQYSEGGCSLIYNGDIAKRLCTPSELKRCKDGERNPNSRENWIDVQARALSKAACSVRLAICAAIKEV